MIPVTVAWLAFLLFFHAILNSTNSVVYVMGISISTHYLPPFILSIYATIYSTYRVLFVCASRIVVNVYFEGNFTVLYNIKKSIIRLKCFDVILNQNELNFKNKRAYGIIAVEEDKYEYIGIKEIGSDQKNIYLIPYDSCRKNELIQLLLEHGGRLIDSSQNNIHDISKDKMI